MEDRGGQEPPSPSSPRQRDATAASRPELIARWKRRSSYFSRQPSEAQQGSGSPNPESPRTPRTPGLGRSISSNLNSPGISFKPDDDSFVFEIGTRYLRAGLGAESQPRCTLDFGPKTQRRPGDYSEWLPGEKIEKSRVLEDFGAWGKDHELWQMDVRGVDLGLVADKIDRAIRQAITDHILVMDDSKKRRYILAVPSVLPHPLLSSMLRSLFNSFPPPPSITLLPTPLLCAISAGLRSALVVDIGWAATTVSALYEYREAEQRSSTRGTKRLSWNVKSMIETAVKSQFASDQDAHFRDWKETAVVSFQEVEEIVTRIIWCNSENNGTEEALDPPIAVPLRSLSSGESFTLPFSNFASPTETTFFSTDQLPDDEELPLPRLIYETLLSLAVDIRETCITRIIFTGGGSNIPGLKDRVIAEVDRIIDARGWDPVHNYGSAKRPQKRTNVRQNGPIPKEDAANNLNKDLNPDSTTPAHLQPPLPDRTLETIRTRSAQPTMSMEATNERSTATQQSQSNNGRSELRVVDTLGAWAGASLASGLRVQGLVEVDRERFLHKGLYAGLDKDDARKRQSMVATQQQKRQSMIAGAGKAGDTESGIFSLGIWA